jgi:hypothetical protein
LLFYKLKVNLIVKTYIKKLKKLKTFKILKIRKKKLCKKKKLVWPVFEPAKKKKKRTLPVFELEEIILFF